ncbi:LacI family DNA-binding transcriptional regulator [Terrabacter sp. MAHUQ-38]|uniref:LacI family DNA-binding transcriptional regulator n=1 Tax=unclassified Terrabacter TaxID=2630222 RepID=UPI0021074E50|nr:LacI family DNA-binding transcriptional regulator [Terrabacter sp. MAHUQ-38]
MVDVAKRAGVSQPTVSAVVNGRARTIGIAESTEARVRQAMEELGYRPNLAARSLRLQQTKTIGFITDHIGSGPFGGRMVLGAQEEAWLDGHLLLLVNTAGDVQRAEVGVQALNDRRVDGLLYARMIWGATDLPPGLSAVPSMLINCWERGSGGATGRGFRLQGRPYRGHPAVLPSELRGGWIATTAALDAGHRRLGFIRNVEIDPASEEREAGFRRALAERGIPVNRRWIVRAGSGEIDDGYRAARALLDAADRPTALICFNDRVAVGAIVAAGEVGLRVPADLSVVGYDDDEELASHYPPGLTTVALPHFDLGRVAVKALLRSIKLGEPLDSHQVEGYLVTRSTLGPPPEQA